MILIITIIKLIIIPCEKTILINYLLFNWTPERNEAIKEEKKRMRMKSLGEKGDLLINHNHYFFEPFT